MPLTEKEEIEYLSLLEAEHKEQIKARDMMPQTDDELWRYIRAFFGVHIPRVAVCSGHVSPFQFVADVFFQRELNVLGFASRDSGKTKNMSIIHQINSHFKAGCDSCSVGAIELQAKKCYQYIQEYASGRGWYGDIVETSRIGDTIYKNGSKVSILPGTISSVNCISGDTRVDCPRNINQYRKGIPIRELVGKEFFVYSFNCEKRCVELKKAFNVHCSGLNVPVYEVAFEWTKRGANKKSRVGTIKTTGHHLFLLKNGQYKRADCLQEGDKLKSFCKKEEVSVVTRGIPAGYEDVYDMAVEDNHNFVANGVFVHNSPHPQIAVFDEVELTEWNIFQEFLNMAHSTDKIKAQNILISTRKFLSGTMQRILDEQRFKVYQYCVFEVARRCTDADCSQCQKSINGKWADGTIRTFAGVCKGRMRLSDGFVGKDDIVNRFETLDRNTWETQQECLSPERSGLVHAWFDKPTDGVEVDPYVGLYEGVDWGADDPSVCLWGQKVGQEIRIFDEIYQSGLGVQDFIGIIQGKRLAEGYRDYISETFVDPSGRAARIDFENAGINTSIDFAKDVEYGIAVLRSLGEKGLIKISSRCVNLIRELGEYRKKPPKDGSVKYSFTGDDHACDALRYLVLGMIAQESGMPSIRKIGSD